MKVGSVVRVIVPPEDCVDVKGSVERGALAVIVDGNEKFPKLYKDFLSRVRGKNTEEFVWVEWIKNDGRWKGRIDGVYAKWRFSPLRIVNRHLN